MFQMATHNDITGDAIQTRVNSDKFRSGWDAIFGKQEATQTPPDESKESVSVDVPAS